MFIMLKSDNTRDVLPLSKEQCQSRKYLEQLHALDALLKGRPSSDLPATPATDSNTLAVGYFQADVLKYRRFSLAVST
jgi:hypothetical protein